ncbi:hypothetical protein [uncultured Arcobacter sp.]|uniref:ATP-dependent DNA ligase n=1 Tax=uncultured Arcobacter sp. TaxID=165434 RepID=UPI0026220AB5|nr:hypothetical protein [uncultured Arcobacter sp.]
MEFVEVIKELRETRSSKEKVEKLSKYKSDELFKEFFDMVYNPYVNTYIKKVPKFNNGENDAYSMLIEFKNLFYALSSRNISGNTAQSAVKGFLDRCDADAYDIYTCILKQNLKMGMDVKSINKAMGDIIEVHEVQRANKYEPSKDPSYYKTNMFYASAKLDGLRCTYLYEKDKLLTRGGKEIIGMEYIQSKCKQICERFNVNLIDGELYTHGVPFQTIQSIVTTEKNVNPTLKNKIDYIVFALDGEGIIEPEDMYITLSQLDKPDMLGNSILSEHDRVRAIKYEPIANDPKAIEAKCIEYVEQGFEGIMLRHPEIHYDNTRSNNLLKYKLFIEHDFEIIGILEGTEKYAGMLGAVKCRGEFDGKVVEFECGSGWSDKERMMYFNSDSSVVNAYYDAKLLNITGSAIAKMDIMKEKILVESFIEENDKDYLKGKLLETKFQGLTDKPNDENVWSLRFPIANKLKLDR